MNWSNFGTRKVMLGAAASLATVGTWLATNWLPLAGQYYGTMVMGLSAIYATYCGANMGADHIANLRDVAMAKSAPKPKPTPPVEPLPEE